MGWNNQNNIVKHKGLCHNRATQKFCFYWRAKHSKKTKRVIGFRCSLFDKDKEGYTSLPECNAKYGLTYDKLINQ